MSGEIMDKKQVLELAKSMLESVKKDPSQASVLQKAVEALAKPAAAMKKDDMPHPAGSPEDKAHDVKEEDQSLQQALALLDTPEKQAAMLAHLQSLAAESQERSPENQEAGQEQMDKAGVMPNAQIKSPSLKAPASQPAPKMAPKMSSKAPAPKAAGPLRMSKEEIKADLKQEFKPRFKKGCK